MTTTFETIYTPGVAFAGYNYRATSDGQVVRVQVKKPGSRQFRTAQTLSLASWKEFEAKNELNNPYKDSPKPIAELVWGLSNNDNDY